jgi:hypothetical protein
MNDLTLFGFLLGLPVIFLGLAFIGAIVWLGGKVRKGPEIF